MKKKKKNEYDSMIHCLLLPAVSPATVQVQRGCRGRDAIDNLGDRPPTVHPTSVGLRATSPRTRCDDSMIRCCQLSHQQQCKSKGEAEGEMPTTTWVTGLRQCTPLLWV